jgi:hypothetical protein
MYHPKSSNNSNSSNNLNGMNQLNELDLSTNYDDHRLINPLDELSILNTAYGGANGQQNQHYHQHNFKQNIIKPIAQTPSMSSVDSLLMHNFATNEQPQYQQQPQQQQQQQNQQCGQTSGGFYFQTQLQLQQQLAAAAPPKQQYRKVRPEPVAEKSIVNSVVGFFQDKMVDSGGVSGMMSGMLHGHHHHHHHHHHHGSGMSSEMAQAKRIQQQSAVAAGLASANASAAQLANEIKEQVEWLHFENVLMLDSSRNYSGGKSQASPFNEANIVLVMGYKTGFSVWIIDVSIFVFNSVVN